MERTTSIHVRDKLTVQHHIYLGRRAGFRRSRATFCCTLKKSGSISHALGGACYVGFLRGACMGSKDCAT